MNAILKAFFKGLLEAGANVVEAAGESKLVEILQKLHDSDRAKWEAAFYGGKALVAALKPLAEGTATGIDDAFVNGLEAALNESAADNGLTFGEVNATDDDSDPNHPPPPPPPPPPHDEP